MCSGKTQETRVAALIAFAAGTALALSQSQVQAQLQAQPQQPWIQPETLKIPSPSCATHTHQRAYTPTHQPPYALGSWPPRWETVLCPLALPFWLYVAHNVD